MKIISAIPYTPQMSKEEIEKFLESKLLLQLATIDEKGDPNIQPLWFTYNKEKEKLLVVTPKMSKKIQYLINNKKNVYFSVDDENFPYKGVKGKGSPSIIEEQKRTILEAEKISLKYLGNLDHPIPQMIIESAKKGNHVLIEITPKFFSTWDFSKMS